MRYIVLESKWGNGIFTDPSWPVPLKFKSGRASVSEERFKEVSLHPLFGKEFGKLGTIYQPYGFRHVRVQRSESDRSNAADSIDIPDGRLGSPRQRAEIVKKEIESGLPITIVP